MPPSSVPLTLTVLETLTSPDLVGQVGTVAADAACGTATMAATTARAALLTQNP